jgi:hypothetical protein
LQERKKNCKTKATSYRTATFNLKLQKPELYLRLGRITLDLLLPLPADLLALTAIAAATPGSPPRACVEKTAVDRHCAPVAHIRRPTTLMIEHPKFQKSAENLSQIRKTAEKNASKQSPLACKTAPCIQESAFLGFGVLGFKSFNLLQASHKNLALKRTLIIRADRCPTTSPTQNFLGQVFLNLHWSLGSI